MLSLREPTHLSKRLRCAIPALDKSGFRNVASGPVAALPLQFVDSLCHLRASGRVDSRTSKETFKRMLGYVSLAHQSPKWELFCSEYQQRICGAGLYDSTRSVSNRSVGFNQTDIFTLLR